MKSSSTATVLKRKRRDVKDKTVRKIDPEKLAGDNTLKGEFIRRVLESDETEEKKSRIISIGLKALSGREID